VIGGILDFGFSILDYRKRIAVLCRPSFSTYCASPNSIEILGTRRDITATTALRTNPKAASQSKIQNGETWNPQSKIQNQKSKMDGC